MNEIKLVKDTELYKNGLPLLAKIKAKSTIKIDYKNDMKKKKSFFSGIFSL